MPCTVNMLDRRTLDARWWSALRSAPDKIGHAVSAPRKGSRLNDENARSATCVLALLGLLAVIAGAASCCVATELVWVTPPAAVLKVVPGDEFVVRVAATSDAVEANVVLAVVVGAAIWVRARDCCPPPAERLAAFAATRQMNGAAIVNVR